MMKIMIAALLALAVAGCTSPNDAREALTSAGFKDISTGGYAFFACSEDDKFHTKFSATNVAGERVSGVVCSGFFKGSTIRF